MALGSRKLRVDQVLVQLNIGLLTDLFKPSDALKRFYIFSVQDGDWKNICGNFKYHAPINGEEAYMTFTVVRQKGKEKYEREYAIGIDTTKANYGTRYWFKCECGLRSAYIYMLPDDDEFHCRACCDLTYFSTASQRSYYYENVTRPRAQIGRAVRLIHKKNLSAEDIAKAKKLYEHASGKLSGFLNNCHDVNEEYANRLQGMVTMRE